MKLFTALLVMSLGMASASLSARTYDLEQCHLASPIREMVQDARANGSYDHLPNVIKDVHENMERGNCKVADIKTLLEVTDQTMDYLSKKYHRQVW